MGRKKRSLISKDTVPIILQGNNIVPTRIRNKSYLANFSFTKIKTDLNLIR